MRLRWLLIAVVTMTLAPSLVSACPPRLDEFGHARSCRKNDRIQMQKLLEQRQKAVARTRRIHARARARKQAQLACTSIVRTFAFWMPAGTDDARVPCSRL